MLALGLALLLACARPLPPPGGPADETPPHLAAAVPESGAVGLAGVRTLRFTFSEKMNRDNAVRWLSTFPRLEIRKTSWHGSREAEVELQEPLPPDTVVVIEVGPGMRDAHGVPREETRRYPVATARAIPGGEIAGGLIFEDKPLTAGVVELYAVPPETLRYFQQPVLRRAATDSTGRFRFRWLPVPGGPYLLRAFHDRNADLRPGDNEGQRLLPDTVSLRRDEPRRLLELATIFAPSTPGSLTGALATRPAVAGSVLAYTLGISEQDTGWAPAPQASRPPNLTLVPDSGSVVIPGVGPGLVRAIFYVDTDGDSLLSVVPPPGDAPVDTAGADSVTMWTLEPWALVDSLEVEPGLPAPFPAPVWPDTLTWWPAPPPPAAPDTTLAGTAADSLAGTAPVDSVPPAPEDGP